MVGFRLLVALAFCALLLTATLYVTAPFSYATPPARTSPVQPPRTSPVPPVPSQPLTQTFTLGDQQLQYAGDQPLRVEPGVYWDTPPATAQMFIAVDSRGPHLVVEPGPTDEVRFIVQLDGEPVAGRRASLESQGYAARLRQAQGDLLKALDAQGIPVHVRQQYVYVYNGLAITARAGDREAIARTPGVRAVYPDYEVQVLLPQSVPLIGVPTVWTMHDAGGQPVTGTGVRVAVIDTGIDYNHPDLGGPGFPNTRIITGYNFVADSFDPWDDWGHGTHVAGIVGASGHLTGVAPAASLMAYKVVDTQTGYAQTSDTIAAIERALDPDGNPGTDDGAHVVNISLGDPGDPDDPLSQACDNAVAAGAVVVVGAGNSGPRYQSLTSPGLARRVIGVGATDKSDVLASFSSRGPVPASWAIKPDVVAPGVSISSTFPGGGYVYGSGTSASTPHVAGAAALLRQLHPAWSPAYVQAALMNTAKDLGRSPYDQGAGRIQVDKAAVTPALILPPSLSLGRVDPAQLIWSRQEALTVSNVSTSTVTYTLSIVGSFPAGVTLAVSPTQTVAGPGGSAHVTFTVAVDTATVPDKSSAPFAYWGALRATPVGLAAPMLRVPFAFVKAPLVRLHVDEPAVSVMFLRHDPLTSWYVQPTTTTLDYLLPAGAYDVVVQYRQPYAYVVRTVELTQTVEITMPRAAAIHQVRIAFTDENGQPAVPNHAFHRFMQSGNGWLVNEVAATAPITEIVRFSDVPTTYVWERTVACADPTDTAYRQWHGRAVGITTSLEFLTTPADFARVDHPLRALPGAAAYQLTEWLGYSTPSYAVAYGPTVPTVTVPYVRQAYYRTPPPGHELYMLRTATVDPPRTASEGAVMSPWLQLDADRSLIWRQPRGSSVYYQVPAVGAEPLGLGPVYWFAQFAINTPDKVRLVPVEGGWLYYRAYQGGDVSLERRQPYELWQNGTRVQAGDIGMSTGGSSVLISLPTSGTYTMTLPFTYTLGTTDVVTGHGRMVARFDTTRYATDANPPFVKALRILEDGQPTDVAAGPVELHLVITDAITAAPIVTVAYNVGAGWVPVTATRVVNEYVAHLPGFADGTAVHLQITAADAAGNVMVHTLEPAYLVRWWHLYLPMAFKDAL